MSQGWLWAESSPNPDQADCEFVPLLEETGDVSRNRLAYYAEMRAYVRHEDDLINSRLTSALTVHGFLFAAYGLIVGKAIDLSSNLATGSSSASSSHGPFFVLLFILVLITLTGAQIGFYSRNAIVAGFNAIAHINQIVHLDEPLVIPTRSGRSKELLAWALQGKSGWLLPRITSGGAPQERTKSAYQYYRLLPLTLGIFWLLLFVLTPVLLLYFPHAAAGQKPNPVKQIINIDLAALINTHTGSPPVQFLGCVGPFGFGKDSSITTSALPQRCGTVNDVVRQIRNATNNRSLTSLPVVGSADKFELKPQLRNQYATNSGLARARTKYVIDGLIGSKIISPEQIITVTVGPRDYAKGASAADTAGDRTVAIWGLFSS